MEHQGGSMLDLFSVDPGLVLWTWIAFFLLLIILKKFALKPLLGMIKQREDLLNSSVDDANKIKEELKGIAKKQEEMLKDAEKQSLEILRKSREAAEKTAREINEKASRDAEAQLEKAKEQIAHEKDRAMVELKQECVDMVVKTTAKLINESVSSAKHEELIKRSLEEF